MDSLPIACSLAPQDLERRKQALQAVVTAVGQSEPLTNGLRFHFANDEGVQQELIALIQFERVCCPFLTFDLHFEHNNGPISLSVTGPEGTRKFLGEVFGIPAA